MTPPDYEDEVTGLEYMQLGVSKIEWAEIESSMITLWGLIEWVAFIYLVPCMAAAISWVVNIGGVE